VYIIIPKFKEWLMVNCVINDVKGFLLGLSMIFICEKIKYNYIKDCKPRTCMVMPKKT
jgi:hypothetical protein